jgi:hypothetical protein
VSERQTSQGSYHTLGRQPTQPGRQRQGGTLLGQWQWNQLKMFMRLTGSGRSPSVVKAESLELDQALPERLEIGFVQQRLLMFELAGDDEQVIVKHLELVEQTDVRIRNIRHVQVWIIG